MAPQAGHRHHPPRNHLSRPSPPLGSICKDSRHPHCPQRLLLSTTGYLYQDKLFVRGTTVLKAKVIETQLKVTCRPAVLGQALQVVSRAISVRSTLPILKNILIWTTSNDLARNTTNLEIRMRKLLPYQML